MRNVYLIHSVFYAATKLFQEQQINLYKEKLFHRTTIFRFQNVYGEGQSLNPYTGILAVFFNLANDNKSLNVFEDGLENLRNFIHVDNVVETMRCSIFSDDSHGMAFLILVQENKLK